MLRRNTALTSFLICTLLLAQGLFDLLPLFVPPTLPPAGALSVSTASLETDQKHTSEISLSNHSAFCRCLQCRGGRSCCCKPEPGSGKTALNPACDAPAQAHLAAPLSVRLVPACLRVAPPVCSRTLPPLPQFIVSAVSCCPRPALRPPALSHFC